MSSANLESPILSPPMSAPSFGSSSAIAIIISRNMLNSKGDKTHPCSTSITVSNHSDSSPFTRTAQKVSCMHFLVLLLSIAIFCVKGFSEVYVTHISFFPVFLILLCYLSQREDLVYCASVFSESRLSLR